MGGPEIWTSGVGVGWGMGRPEIWTSGVSIIVYSLLNMLISNSRSGWYHPYIAPPACMEKEG